MNSNKAKEMLPIISAFAGGKKIEVLDCGVWEALDDLYFDLPVEKYRIVKEPKLRAWKNGIEAPMPCLIRFGDAEETWQYQLLSKNDSEVVIMALCGESRRYTFQSLLNSKANYSTDNGKSWHPCGIA